MPERRPKTVYFPHVIPGKSIGNKIHTFNSINGGMKRVADLGLDPTTFFGGNVRELGLIKEYGFYAIPSQWTSEILGFYLYDPAMVTDLGKQILKDYFQMDTLVYGFVSEASAVVRDDSARAELIAEYEKAGGISSMVRHVHVDELRSMLEALKSGKAELQYADMEAPITNEGMEDAKITKPVTKGKPSKAIVDQVRKASR